MGGPEGQSPRVVKTNPLAEIPLTEPAQPEAKKACTQVPVEKVRYAVFYRRDGEGVRIVDEDGILAVGRPRLPREQREERPGAKPAGDVHAAAQAVQGLRLRLLDA